MIGIDDQARLYYEGSGPYGRALWPNEPFLSIATVIRSDSDYSSIPEGTDLGRAALIFREDYFDPITRVRRGRFYARNDPQPSQWTVPPHPSLPDESARASVHGGGRLTKPLFSFYDWPAAIHISPIAAHATIVLGVRRAATRWRIIAIEQISTKEDLVTLKALSNMGVLPELIEAKIPSAHLGAVSNFIARVVDTAYRSGPEAVVDRCRDAAAAVLAAQFGNSKKDLAGLANRAESEKKYIVGNAAKILALLHARAKPSEQANRFVPHPAESDAALALCCLNAILREIGWAADDIRI